MFQLVRKPYKQAYNLDCSAYFFISRNGGIIAYHMVLWYEKKYHHKCVQTEDGHSVKAFAHNCLFLQS